MPVVIAILSWLVFAGGLLLATQPTRDRVKSEKRAAAAHSRDAQWFIQATCGGETVGGTWTQIQPYLDRWFLSEAHADVGIRAQYRPSTMEELLDF